MLPRYRQPPSPDDLGEDNNYVSGIKELRQSIRGAKDWIGNLVGPIGHALETIKDFSCSASEWGAEHLKRFQAVIFDGQRPRTMFLDNFIPKHNDPVMIALQTDGFFKPNAEDVIAGRWESNKLHNNFFLDLMHLLEPQNTPRSSFVKRNTKPRPAKETAKESISRLIRCQSVAERSLSLTRVSSGESMFSVGTSTQSGTVINYGPRETSSHSLFHNYLKYIATIEYEQQAIGEEPTWLPW